MISIRTFFVISQEMKSKVKEMDDALKALFW
jgi:hypothetical protein